MVDGFSALGFTLPKSKCKPVGLFLGGSGKSLLPRSFRWLTESSFFVVVGLRSLFPYWLSARSHSQCLGATYIPLLMTLSPSKLSNG